VFAINVSLLDVAEELVVSTSAELVLVSAPASVALQ
jgi:hypothetical protein